VVRTFEDIEAVCGIADELGAEFPRPVPRSGRRGRTGRPVRPSEAGAYGADARKEILDGIVVFGESAIESLHRRARWLGPEARLPPCFRPAFFVKQINGEVSGC
jgi:hypothetical protein